jgi:hypothetical protein
LDRKKATDVEPATEQTYGVKRDDIDDEIPF